MFQAMCPKFVNKQIGQKTLDSFFGVFLRKYIRCKLYYA